MSDPERAEEHEPVPDPSAPPPPEVEAQPYDARSERGPTVDAPPPPPAGGAQAGAGASGRGASFKPALCHLAFLVGWIVPGTWPIGPLVAWQLMRQDPAVDDQGREAVNFQLNVLAWSILLPFTCIGVLLLPVLWGAQVVLSFVAAYRASEGELYRYPLTFRILQP